MVDLALRLIETAAYLFAYYAVVAYCVITIADWITSKKGEPPQYRNAAQDTGGAEGSTEASIE